VPGTVDQDDRDVLGVLICQSGVVLDGQNFVADSTLGANAGHHDLRGFAEVTARPGDDLHPNGVRTRIPTFIPARTPAPACTKAARGFVHRRHVSYPADVGSPDLLTSYRRAGQASASAASEVEHEASNGAAFFDVDNTIMRGSSLFHLAVGLAKRKYFNASEISGFARKQLKFVLSGSEDLEDMASATEAALSFVENRSVNELQGLAEEIFDTEMVDKLIPGTLALAQGHLDAGQQVWLVTATPQELAAVIAKRLGLTGALGTVAQSNGGTYTGTLNGPPLHGLAKAEAVRALALSEGLDLSECSAYSDSVNDIPMLSTVGRPTAVNPDPELRAHAVANDWKIRDFRRRARIKPYIAPVTTGAAGIAIGVASGYVLGQVRGRR